MMKESVVTNIVDIERVVFEYHYHEDGGKSSTHAKREMKETLERLGSNPYCQ